MHFECFPINILLNIANITVSLMRPTLLPSQGSFEELFVLCCILVATLPFLCSSQGLHTRLQHVHQDLVRFHYA